MPSFVFLVVLFWLRSEAFDCHITITFTLIHDYIEVVTCIVIDSFSSPVHLPCVHRSCGEPRGVSWEPLTPTKQ